MYAGENCDQSTGLGANGVKAPHVHPAWCGSDGRVQDFVPGDSVGLGGV